MQHFFYYYYYYYYYFGKQKEVLMGRLTQPAICPPVWDLAIPAEAVQLLARPKVNLLLRAAPGLRHDTDGNRGGRSKQRDERGTRASAFVKAAAAGPWLDNSHDKARRLYQACGAARPSSTSAGSCGNKRQRQGGREGTGAPAAEGQRCCKRHRCHAGEGLERTSCCPLLPK